MCYENIETGGDLFGLWKNENEVVVQLVTGPGKHCRRTTTAFFQDPTYLSSVGEFLTSAKGLCNIGEWHSHHRLNLPEPSGGDKATVWRNMPSCGLKRFLLIIATITPEGQVNINGFMFTAPENGSMSGGMQPVKTRVLTGPNPFRTLPDVQAKLQDGVESPPHMTAPSPIHDLLKNDDTSSLNKPIKSNEKPEKSKQGRLGNRMLRNYKKKPGYEEFSNDGRSSGHFLTRNEKETNPRDYPTPQHVSTQREDGRPRHQQARSAPGYNRMSQTSSQKVTLL